MKIYIQKRILPTFLQFRYRVRLGHPSNGGQAPCIHNSHSRGWMQSVSVAESDKGVLELDTMQLKHMSPMGP